ncbi:MAG: stage II sporulation protein R [Oscillospiraceae bacterium]|jgi:stage II sporulation protein R|nr:stage II sporulation protein R [Ruminococcus sp.]MDY3087596.1 stage II sporulation protein R [Oscillospiraceae bacterium]
MSLSKKIKISVTVGIVVAILFSICSFAKTSEEIRSDVLRLHVIANSDTSVDQNLKLRLRDYILQEGKDIFNGSVNVENAVEKIEPVLPELEKSAKAFVNQAGFDYDVKISLSNEYFTTRTYETVTLPAGKYLALRVVIGSGEGHNWWCVMFPPMCVPAADKKDEIENVFSEKEIKLVESKPKYEPRFKVVEIYEQLKEIISEKSEQSQ